MKNIIKMSSGFLDPSEYFDSLDFSEKINFNRLLREKFEFIKLH